MAAPQGPPAGPKNSVTGGEPPDKVAGGPGDLGRGPESGAAEVDVACDPPDWSYSYSMVFDTEVFISDAVVYLNSF